VHHLHEDARRVAARQVRLRRIHERGAGGAGPEDPPRDRREDRSHRLGAAADRPRPLLGRHPGHRHRLVFFAEDSGALLAVDASSGAPLWHFQTNTLWKASPMTYVFDGKQHIAVASGPNILSFALVE
jgi:PQQ enzyme repeat